jgi:hypothetical protein
MIKFTEEELATIRTLNDKNRAVTTELGEIELAKLQLEKRRKYAEEYLANLRAEQEANGKALTEKYGNGNIDLETGEFTPIEE